MANNNEIGEALLIACIRAGYTPSKVEFAKYLYQLDYCHCRKTGQKATTFPWKFHHLGPWCDEADECMKALSKRYDTGWELSETEKSKPSRVISQETAPQISPVMLEIIDFIIKTFKDKELPELLNATYFDTEPMVNARRGNILDFSKVAISKDYPNYFPKPTVPQPYTIPPEIQKEIDAIRAEATELIANAEECMRFRQTPEYLEAMELLSQEMTEQQELPSLRVTLTPNTVESLKNKSNDDAL